MGISRTVSIDEIKAGNPRLCLSPLRYLGKCFECPVYQNKKGKPCNSRIESEEGKQAEQLKAEKAQLKAKIEELNQKLKSL